jgi:phage tail protein X
MLVTAQQGDTLDKLAWRHLGATAGVVEATLVANPTLAELGPVLPLGTPVNLISPSAAVTTQTVSLWA